jgi:phospholipid-binding lipoprotein MlaA
MADKESFLMLTVISFVLFFGTLGYAGVPAGAGSQLYTARLNINPDYFLLAQADDSVSTEEDDFDDELMDEFDTDQDQVFISDPLYYFNYAMYSFNDVFYLYLFEPMSKGYKAVTPTTFRKGVRNFFYNLLFPVRFVNNLLQGEIADAGSEAGIFLVNSTAGVLGFGQVAQNSLDMETADEDLGQTFGAWGIGNGFYLVLPILGPSSLRDTVGLAGDSFLKPVNYLEPWELSLGVSAYERLNITTFYIGDYKALKDAAIDPYAALRDAYIQNRAEKVKE